MLSYLHNDTMEAKLTLKLITEVYLQASEHLEPSQLSFSFTPCSWMIVIVWRDCFMIDENSIWQNGEGHGKAPYFFKFFMFLRGS